MTDQDSIRIRLQEVYAGLQAISKRLETATKELGISQTGLDTFLNDVEQVRAEIADLLRENIISLTDYAQLQEELKNAKVQVHGLRATVNQTSSAIKKMNLAKKQLAEEYGTLAKNLEISKEVVLPFKV